MRAAICALPGPGNASAAPCRARRHTATQTSGSTSGAVSGVSRAGRETATRSFSARSSTRTRLLQPGHAARSAGKTDESLVGPLLPGGEPVEQLLRRAQFFVPGTPPGGFREVHQAGGRGAEEFYRERWRRGTGRRRLLRDDWNGPSVGATLGVVLPAAGVAVTASAGFLGGTLIKDYHVGVRRPPGMNSPSQQSSIASRAAGPPGRRAAATLPRKGLLRPTWPYNPISHARRLTDILGIGRRRPATRWRTNDEALRSGPGH